MVKGIQSHLRVHFSNGLGAQNAHRFTRLDDACVVFFLNQTGELFYFGGMQLYVF